MKYINQLDYPHWPYITKTKMEGEDFEKGKTTTIKTSSCGLCSAVMVADRLIPNCDFDLEKARQLSYDVKANPFSGTNYKIFAPAFAEMLGLKYEKTSNPEHLLHCLRTGGVAVANVGGDREGYVGVFSHIGHYIVIIGEEPDGRLTILDPAYKEGKFEEEGRAGKVEVVHGVIALCDIKVLIKETENRTPSYHLFWRA